MQRISARREFCASKPECPKPRAKRWLNSAGHLVRATAVTVATSALRPTWAVKTAFTPPQAKCARMAARSRTESSLLHSVLLLDLLSPTRKRVDRIVVGGI